MNARAVMARAVAAVIQERLPLDEALRREWRHLAPVAGKTAAGAKNKTAKDKALIQEVCFGVARHYPSLSRRLTRLLDKPAQERDGVVHALLLCGLYQLHYLNTADHAAVSETVAAARQLRKPWAAAVVNAVLRRSQRECLSADGAADGAADRAAEKDDESVVYLHPPWMIERIRRDWPGHWRQILHANNGRPPQHLRVNLRLASRADGIARLAAAGIHARPVSPAASAPAVATAIEVTPPVAVHDLPGFERGLYTAQDAGAQCAAPMLAPAAGERVLDACAAPGGKTGHLYEYEPDLAELLAVDIAPHRCESLRETLRRVGAKARVLCADICAPRLWWDGRGFDRILLDAPCSASGVIRRHPDIKLLRAPEQLPALRRRQLRMLQAVWPLLKPGGVLLYATCSVFREENDAVIGRFLQAQGGAESVTIGLAMGIKSDYGRQLLPGAGGADGFYYSLLRKAAGDAQASGRGA